MIPPSDVDDLARFQRVGLLLDSNVLLVWLIARQSPEQVYSHKRTQAFDREACRLLLEVADRFNQWFTTPFVLAEVSNLIGKDEGLRAQLSQFIELAREIPIAARTVVEKPFLRALFLRMGLADAAFFALRDDPPLVLTVDLKLYRALLQHQQSVCNFTHLRRPYLDPG